MIYDFFLNGRNITADILDFEYSENLDEVASSFSFSSLRDFGLIDETDNKNPRIYNLTIRDRGSLVYFGYITKVEHSPDQNVYKYSGFDVGFYLNQNQVVIQFRGVNIGDAIRRLCTENRINLAALPNYNRTVAKIYKGASVAEVLKDLQELERGKGGIATTYIDCKSGALRIRSYSLLQNLRAFYSNDIPFNATGTIKDVSVSQTFENRKNRILVANNDEKSVATISLSDAAAIRLYGQLTHVERVDTNKNNNLPQIVRDKLIELNQNNTQISLTMLGDWRIAKGVVIPINVPEYGLSGNYLILSAKHSIDDKREEIQLTVRRRLRENFNN